MKGRIFVTLFALPFAGFGGWMLWSISTSLLDAWQLQNWEPTSATVENGGYRTNSGGDSTSWEAYARYRYQYQGQSFTGDRVALGSGGDNIGDYQRRLGSRLERAAARGSLITVYVNPARPAESIVDRGVRWGLVGFKSLFVVVFGGVGLGLIIFTWRTGSKYNETVENPHVADSPWLQNDDWQSDTVRSSARASTWGAWFFAAIWCLVSSPLPFVAHTEVVQKGNVVALLALLFPLVGIGLLVRAVRRSREWRRFGAAPVTLDPFPGSIGGHVGGRIDLALPFDPTARFELTLTALHSDLSGSGKNRSRREKADWQDTRLAHAEPGSQGTRLTFRFDVPEGLSPSDASRSGERYRLWRLELQASLPGPDLDRSYELPVYATGLQSQRIAEPSATITESQQAEFDRQQLARRFHFEQSAAGPRLFFPMGRNTGSGLMGGLVGALFAGAGTFIILEKGGVLVGGVFAAVGGLIGLASICMTLNSLEVRRDGNDLLSVRRLLGIPIRRKRMPRHAFYRLEKYSNMQSQSGRKHTVHYRVNAVDRQGHSMLLGEGFHGESEARAAMRFIAISFGLPLPGGDGGEKTQSAAGNVLAADS